jgi:hypothetical protein
VLHRQLFAEKSRIHWVRSVGKQVLHCTSLNILQNVTKFFFYRLCVHNLPEFLIGKLCVQHGDFTKSACLSSKDVASVLNTQTKFFFYTFYGLRRGLSTISLRCLFYEGRAAVFEPELVKLAALTRYQWAIPALEPSNKVTMKLDLLTSVNGNIFLSLFAPIKKGNSDRASNYNQKKIDNFDF